MPLDKSLKRVMIIGSGPIVIGQAAEFDYAGTQACKALRSLGIEVILVNSNPATIMTDSDIADKVYIEPLTVEILKRLIEKERPDGLLSTIGGQNGLTLSMQLARDGWLASKGVRLLGASLETIDRAEDRQLFKEMLEKLGEPVIPSGIATKLDDAMNFAAKIGYPVIVRPSFTLGGTGGGIAENPHELEQIARRGLEVSPVSQVLIERSVAGWKEIEFEVMRDSADNCITVCSMENLDPVGVHTGDSIVVAPTLTLSDKEYQMLRSASLRIVRELKVQGGCNVQFALNPDSFEYAVIEVNPRVSRSSALASKATGYPIAKVSAMAAMGLRLDEIPNAITGQTTAFYEPALDYVVVKMPRWPFDKFNTAARTLGPQMKATGEVMAIAPTFEEALMKSVRGAEIRMDTLRMESLTKLDTAEIERRLHEPTDQRLFTVYEALSRGISIDRIHEITKIDRWFLCRIAGILAVENELAAAHSGVSGELYRRAKSMGFPDCAIERLSGCQIAEHRTPVYRMVDTCAAEFAAKTPYFYAAAPAGAGSVDEAAEFIAESESGRKSRGTIVVLGSGPIRIGQGIEFDYAAVHCVWALKRQGYTVVMINNNPETVSTDFDTADRLYFEPLTAEDVLDIINVEKPLGVVVAFGGQTAIKLTKTLDAHGITILGTSAAAIDAAENREKFDEILNRCGIARPKGHAVTTLEEALNAAHDVGYPVLLRPSYVLGGQNMVIAYDDESVTNYMNRILSLGSEGPVLIDKYLEGTEVEVDAVCDGKDVLIPGIMEHIERAGVHSGDSIAAYPAWNLPGPVMEKLVESTARIAQELGTCGLVNIQYVIYHNEVYVIESNPRASRTIPYISKVTGLPLVDIATQVMLATLDPDAPRLKDLPCGTGLYRPSPYRAVKVPVFSFEKLSGADVQLGPEMKSTGEVLGVGKNFEEALYKGLIAAGYKVRYSSPGGVLLSVQDRDKPEIIEIARRFAALGCKLYATGGTAGYLKSRGIRCAYVGKISNGSMDIPYLLDQERIQYVISTSSPDAAERADAQILRGKAIERRAACLTSLDTARALVDAMVSGYDESNVELVDMAHLPQSRRPVQFVKMSCGGNDYIYIDTFSRPISDPASLSVALCGRRKSVGGSGLVVIMPPRGKADARMEIYDAGGVPTVMGGNVLRGVGKYVYEKLGVKKQHLLIETADGVKEVSLFLHGDEVYAAEALIGKADFTAGKVPVRLNEDGREVISQYFSSGCFDGQITCLNLAGPHCIIMTDDCEGADLKNDGPELESSPIFPQGVNVTYATVEDRRTMRIRTWEHHAGETAGCGTAACAAVAAAKRLGMIDDGDISVKTRGGLLVVRFSPEGARLIGDAVMEFRGEIEV
jgi:carbamoyl-phosphate synthase large subunit